jgi:ribosomal-protein-alanine N-acetyltransferase
MRWRENMKTETARLLMRKPEISDAQDMYKNYTQDSEVTKYLIWNPHKELSDTEKWVEHCMDIWDVDKTLPFVIYHKEVQEVIGMIDFRINGFIVDFGYVLARRFWGQGIMSEAAAPLVRHFIERDGIYRIQAVHDLDNPASGRVMEKLGMQFEGILRKFSLHPGVSDIPRDCKMYSLVK